MEWHPLAAGLALLLAVIGIATSYRLAYLNHLDDLTARRAEVSSQLDRARGDLSRELFAAINLSEGLVSLVKLHAGIDQRDFDGLAAAIVRRSAVIRNVALAPDNVIRYVHPLEGNRTALGVNYMGVPNQREAVLRAIKERRTVVAGPLALVQGGVGIIGRTPIFVAPAADGDPGGERYWGISATVVDFDRLIAVSGLDRLRDTQRIALRGLDGSGREGPAFWGDTEVFQQEPVVLDVPLPSGNWAIAGVPAGGWPPFVVWKSLPFQAGTVLAAFFASLLYGVLRINRQRRVEVEARRRTELELRDANASLVANEAERQRMMAEVERGQRVAALSLFAGGVAHDFNNLLAGLFGNVELARSALPSSSPAHPHLDAAVTAFERARDLSRRLLTFAIGSPPERRAVPVAPFLRECCSLSLSGSNCVWDVLVSGHGAAWDAFGDPNQLSQVFTNILVNARQAMAAGGRVRLTVRNLEAAPGGPGDPATGPCVEVTIEDDGPGIPADVLARVFDPFYTTKATGTGLGLALAHSIVRAHGGQIAVTSPPGRGATFTVTLPAMTAGPGPVEAAAEPAPAAGASSGRILLMDDEPLVRGMASKMLARGGYEVVAASDGDEAVDQCRRAIAEGRPFDAAILDVTVPGAMGGKAAMRHLRTLQPGLPVVLSSGYGELETGTGEEQPTATLPKPYQMHELMACAKAVVGARG